MTRVLATLEARAEAPARVTGTDLAGMRAPCPARCRCDCACKTQLLDLMSRTGSQPRLQRRLCARSGPRGRARTGAGAQQHTASLAADSSGTVTLENVRSSLIRQEDTIIFHMIERSQFARNAAVYTSGGVPVPAYGPDGQAFTFLEYLLRDTEAVHGRIRRYTSPDEHAFFPDALPPMVRCRAPPHPPRRRPRRVQRLQSQPSAHLCMRSVHIVPRRKAARSTPYESDCDACAGVAAYRLPWRTPPRVPQRQHQPQTPRPLPGHHHARHNAGGRRFELRLERHVRRLAPAGARTPAASPARTCSAPFACVSAGFAAAGRRWAARACPDCCYV